MIEKINQIKVLKKEKGWKNEDISKALGIVPNTISNAMCDKKRPIIIGSVLKFLTDAPYIYKLSKEDKASFIEEWNEKFNLKN